MAISKIEVNLYTCERCRHEWVAKDPTAAELPKICPSCKSAYWNTPKRETKAEIEAKAKKARAKKRAK